MKRIILKKKGLIAQVAFFFEMGKVREMGILRLIFKKFLPNLLAIPVASAFMTLFMALVSIWHVVMGLSFLTNNVISAVNKHVPQVTFR